MKRILAIIGLAIFLGYFAMLVMYVSARIWGKDLRGYNRLYDLWTFYVFGYLMGIGFVIEF